MATGAYIGDVNNVQHKIKKCYIGVVTDIPIYEESVGTVNITSSNLEDYFNVTNESYYFAGSDSIFTSNNVGIHGSSAKSTWIAKYNISNISFDYSVSSESGWDKLTIIVGGNTIASGISGTNSSSWSGSLSAGDTISLTYYKDSSASIGNDCGTLSNMSITAIVKTQIGIETRPVARKIRRAYIGDENMVAHLCFPAVDWEYILIDFDYIENNDGTATITGWKNTLNGTPSTELIVPDDSKIIL